MHNPPTAVSLFSGCGGFDLGARNAGIDIVWANDNDPDAAAAYREINKGVPFHEGNIQDVESFPQADILIGCYPCTGFSQAAKRRGKSLKARNLKSNADNYLYQEFLRALRQVQPKLLFVENVKGMLSAADGWFFKQQLKEFKAAGYPITFDLLSASDYGVAQDRKRLFLVGVREDLLSSGAEYIFPKATHGKRGALPKVTLKEAIGSMDEWPEGEFCTRPFHGHYLTRNRKRDWGECSYTIVAHRDHVTLHPIGDPMRKLGKDSWELQGTQNRRLSWRECAILQSLPSNVDYPGDLRAKHKVIGNAVPPLVAENLIRSAIPLVQ